MAERASLEECRDAAGPFQVSLPHWRQRWFLERCLERYKQFLYLRREKPDAFLVPTFDIDLLWHSHMVTTLAS